MCLIHVSNPINDAERWLVSDLKKRQRRGKLRTPTTFLTDKCIPPTSAKTMTSPNLEKAFIKIDQTCVVMKLIILLDECMNAFINSEFYNFTH